MEKINQKSNDSCISTTGTPNSRVPSDTLDNSLKYMNLNFVANSETSSQAKEAFLEYQNLQNSNQEKSNKPLRNKILPSSLALNGVDKSKSEQLIPLHEKSLLEMGYKPNYVDGWEDIVQPSKENLYKLLKNMIDNHIKPSVQVRIGDVTFNCHMMVLQCYSDFFMEFTNETLIQLPEEKITPPAFMMVYDWMLSSQPLVQREGILELFNAANFLRIKELINQCWLCLDDDIRFREDTAFLLYLEARNYGQENLEQLMLMRICKFFLTLVASKEFLTLNAKEICTLLSSNTIGVNSEIEIFMSVVRWLSHNWSEREQHMVDVVKCVRFSLMPPWFLVTLNKNTDCTDIDRIIEHPEVKKMINDGITYTNIQLYYGENRQEFLNLQERFQLIAPMQRQWVYDRECKYHHRLECPNMQNVSYRSFLEYLEMIRSIGKDYWRSLDMDKGTEMSRRCFLCTDCRKSTEPNPATVSIRKSRDQGIQCQSGLKSRKSKAANTTNIIHNNVGGKNSLRRTPRGHPRHMPSSSVSQTNHFINNNITTETETAKDLKYNTESETVLNFDEVEMQKQQQQQEQHPTETIDDNNHPQKQQQQQQQNEQTLQPDVIEQEHIIDTHSLQHEFFNNTDNDDKLSQQQQLLTKPYHKKLQRQEQKHGEYKLQHNKTLTDSCTVIYKRAAGGLMVDVSGDANASQQHQQQHRQQCVMGDNLDDELIKHNIGRTIDGPVVDSKNINEDLLESRAKQKAYTLLDDLARISNHKVLVFGGIDPYCLHCQYVQQHQPIQQHKASQKEIKQQQYYFHQYQHHHQRHHYHQEEQELLQRKRVYSIDSIILNTTSHSHPLRSHQMQTHARAHTQTYSNNNAAADENFGDHVLYYDIDGMEWRHLSHIPFGSRHHHAVVVCNGLIYVIGGTRTALGCTTKSVFEKSIWCFNPQTLKWTLETNLPESRRDFSAIAIDDKYKPCDKVKQHDIGFYVIGGEGLNGRPLSSVWFYNIKRKLWFKKPSLNMGRYGLTAALVNNEIWIAGGIITGNNTENINATTAHVITDTIEIYDLKCTHCDDVLANKHTKEGFSKSNKYVEDDDDDDDVNDGSCATSNPCDTSKNVLKNEKELSAGNCNCIEGQWIKSKLHLRIPRLFGKFCKMPKGQLYMVAGISFNDHSKKLTSLTDIDVFNETQQKWEHAGDLKFARHGHDVALLNDHCFVVIGGVSTFEQCTFNNVEAYCTKTRKCLKDLADLPWPVSGCAVVTIN